MFSLDELKNSVFSKINCLIQSIINSKNHELLVIVTHPAVLEVVTNLHEANLSEPNLIQTIELLNKAKDLKTLLYDMSSHGKSLKEKQKNLKQQQMLHRQIALAATDVGKAPHEQLQQPEIIKQPTDMLHSDTITAEGIESAPLTTQARGKKCC